jgi:hypothetical protein
MPIATLTALDGSSVEIDTPLDFTTHGATTFLVASIAGYLQEFGGGHLEFGDSVAAATEVAFDEEYSLQGGRLRLGSAEHVDGDGTGRRTFRLGVWNGKAYCVKTFIYNRPTRELIEIFGLFTIEERDTGPVLRTDQRGVSLTGSGVQPPKVVNGIKDLGLLEIRRLTPQMRRRFPPWEGAPGRGGELYFDSPRGEGEGSIILVGNSAATRIYREPGLPDDRFAGAAAELRVTWR